jgi:NTP pyrophosphatase (non-canonical NTP hydrolase)
MIAAGAFRRYASYMNSIDSLQTLATRLAEFVDERDWDQFHNPKNLAMALTVEAGELLEHFQWLHADEAESLTPEQREAVALEMADVLMFLVRLADKLGVDLLAAAGRKIELNREKYPVEKARGRATKYDRL